MPRLAIASPNPDVFDPSVSGVAPITKEGTHVPAKKVSQVRKKARLRNITLVTLRIR